MMTTSKVFGISRPGDNAAPPAPSTEQVDAQKFAVLKDALERFMKKEITQAELEVIQNSLK